MQNSYVSSPLTRRIFLSGVGAAGFISIADTILPSAEAAHPLPRSPFRSSRLTVTRSGTLGPGGRDILLIPGLASGPFIWKGLTNHLKGNRLHLVHIGGFAGAPAGPNINAPLLTPLVSELARYIRTQKLHAPALIGHSMGGTLAMMLAISGGLGINRVMVVDMLPEGAAMLGGTSQGMGYLAEQMNGYFTGTKAGRQILAQMVMQVPGTAGSDPQVIAQALTDLARTNLRKRLSAIHCPLWIVYALPSDAQMAASQRQLYRNAYASAPTAKLIGIGPSGHAIMLDQPNKFALTVGKFLK